MTRRSIAHQTSQRMSSAGEMREQELSPDTVYNIVGRKEGEFVSNNTSLPTSNSELDRDHNEHEYDKKEFFWLKRFL